MLQYASYCLSCSVSFSMEMLGLCSICNFCLLNCCCEAICDLCTSRFSPNLKSRILCQLLCIFWAFSGVSGSTDVQVEVEVSRKAVEFVEFVGPLQVFLKSPLFGLFPLYTSFYLEKTDVFNWCLSGFSNMMCTFQCKPFYIPMMFFSLPCKFLLKSKDVRSS